MVASHSLPETIQDSSFMDVSMLLRWCYIWVMPQRVHISVQSPWALTTKKLHIENLFSEAKGLPAGSTHPRREKPSSSSARAAAERAHQSSRRLQPTGAGE